MRLGRYPHLESLRIGCVQYLNAKPLIYGYEGGVCFDHPSRLVELLSNGLLDVALVPIFELLRKPDYDVVDNVSISSRGPVFSVFLAYRGNLKDIEAVSLDTASLSSVHLLKCILGEYYCMSPVYVPSDQCEDENAARLLIGNQAIAFRRAQGSRYQYLDLGEEWAKLTSFPFVYAVWLISRNSPSRNSIAEELRSLKEQGIACLQEIVDHEKEYDAEFRTRYLREYIRYDLGAPEKAGIQKFRELLVKGGLIPSCTPSLVFL